MPTNTTHMDILGYIASILIGISLGLIGGGGSILTVPALVYLFGIDAALSTVYSLFIVGITSLVGSYTYFTKGLINKKTVFIFGIPSIIAVFFTRTYLVPAIPQNVLVIENLVITKNILLMILFAILMLFASYSMIKKCKGENCLPLENPTTSNLFIFLQGIFTGMVTGMVGAGGGFLIIPALVNLLRLEFKKAIGTSLIIIALNAIFGFVISVHHFQIDWYFLINIIFLAIIGVFIGSSFSKKIDGKKLKPFFGWFVLLMGLYILLKETILN